MPDRPRHGCAHGCGRSERASRAGKLLVVHGYGWAGSVAELLTVPAVRWLEELGDHHVRLMGRGVGSQQLAAWEEEHEVLCTALRAVLVARPEAQQWNLVFEYELPLENGRRPDVVVLAGGSIVVVELKQDHLATASARDQVVAYARDLAEYHQSSHGRPVHPVLLLTRARFPLAADGVDVIDPSSLAGVLLERSSPGAIDLAEWLEAPYAPLPTLIEAARRIFLDEPLPAIKRAELTGVPVAVELLGQLAEAAAAEGGRVLAFLAGVPGSGKTLAGLSLVYDRVRALGSATFLSGNGPLVKVLQDALGNKAFVRDLHAFLLTNGINAKTPKEQVIVFDEAQRAWDRQQMREKRGIDRSEPDLLVEIGERLPGWAALVGLLGDGQEIHVGEESGIGQWHDAASPPHAQRAWTVHCPPRLAPSFPGLAVVEHDVLDLTVSLRSRRADRLHDWIASLLAGDLGRAARLAVEVQQEAFPLYLTRHLDDAKRHCQERYGSEPTKRFGLVASSKAGAVLARHGVDSGFMATTRLNVPRWYNSAPTDPLSCCALETPMTEFGCQGLELDLPLVCWGGDVRWDGGSWEVPAYRTRQPLRDPRQLRLNVYRVLLSRGRDGLVIFVPPEPELDKTEHALLAAGVRPLPAPVALCL